MRVSRLVAVMRCLALLLSPVQTAFGLSDGDLDYRFQYGGDTYAPLPYVPGQNGTFSSCNGGDAVVQTDGKVLVAGVCDLSANTNTAQYQYTSVATVMRVNADGTLDTSFGNSPWPAPMAYPAIPGYQFLATGTYVVTGKASIAQRPDGRIVVGGSIADLARFGAQSVALAQLQTDGSYDAAFGNAGVSIQHFSQNLDDDNLLNRIALDAQGNIAVAGSYFQHSAASNPNSDFLVGVVAAQGGSAQLQRFAFDIGGDFADAANDIAIDTQGRYVVAGSVTPANSALECGVIRVDPATLQLDSTFGVQGKQTLSFDTGGFDDDCVSLALRSDDSILLVANVSGNDVGLTHLAANGQLDSNFGLKLLSNTGAASALASVDRVYLQPWDSKIVLAGRSGYDAGGTCMSCAYDFGIVRLTPTGTLDTAFTTSTPGSVPGSVVVDFGIEVPLLTNYYLTTDRAHSIAFSGHELIAAGQSTAASENQSYLQQGRFAVARLVAEDIFHSTFEPAAGVACRYGSVSPSAFATLLADKFDGQPLCIPPTSFSVSGLGSVSVCTTSTCGAQTPGCPVTLHAQAGTGTFTVQPELPTPLATVDISNMPAQIDTFDAPIQYSILGLGQNCTATFSATAFTVSGSLDVQTDHQWGGFPYAVDGATIDSFSTTASGCDATLINALVYYYAPYVTQFLQSSATARLPAAYSGTDVCQR